TEIETEIEADVDIDAETVDVDDRDLLRRLEQRLRDRLVHQRDLADLHLEVDRVRLRRVLERTRRDHPLFDLVVDLAADLEALVLGVAGLEPAPELALVLAAERDLDVQL